MQRFLLAILLLILAAPPLRADSTTVVVGQPTSAAPTYDYCTACPDAGKGADVQCEDFDGTADGRCGWTVQHAGDANGAVNLAGSCSNSPNPLGCTDLSMGYCAVLTKTSATAGDMYFYKANAETDTYRKLFLRITAEGMATDSDTVLWSLSTSDAGTLGSVALGFIKDASDDYYLELWYHVGGSWYTVSRSDEIFLSRWYGIDVKAINSATLNSDVIQWWIDYDLDGTYTDEGEVTGKELDRATAKEVFGSASKEEIISYQITGVRIDNDAMPSDCSR